jgi:GAF domain-containing protein
MGTPSPHPVPPHPPQPNRLRQFADAMTTVSSATELSLVLQHLVQCAVELTGAHHGTLELVDPTGRQISDHIVAGTSAETGEGATGTGVDPSVPVLDVALHTHGRPFGHLRLVGKPHAEAFTAEDDHLIAGLAAAATTAIDNAHLHRQLHRPDTAHDTDQRIDTAIQRLFATALGLHRTVALVHDDPTAARAHIEQAINDLDDTVRAMQTTDTDGSIS